MKHLDYYEHALAAVEAGGQHPIVLLLDNLVGDDEFDQKHAEMRPQRASEIRGWIVPFLSFEDTQHLVDALLELQAPYLTFEELWLAIEYAAPSVIQQNYRRLIQCTASDPFRWGIGWRNATDPEIVEYLHEQIANITGLDGSEQACASILHTRNNELIQSLLRHPLGPFQKPEPRPLYDAPASLAWAGFVQVEGRLVDQTTPRRMHLTFPEGYRSAQKFTHPTHDLDTADLGTATFGGVAEGTCSICDAQLHRYLRLEDQLQTFGVHSRSTLELVVCYDCRDASYEMFDNVLWYHHGADGVVRSRPQPGWSERYRRKLEPMSPTTVDLREAPLDRWVSDYFAPPRFQNQNHLGGVPANSYLWGTPMTCIDCHTVMRFLANITQNRLREPMLFYWCDQCAISGVAGQSSG